MLSHKGDYFRLSAGAAKSDCTLQAKSDFLIRLSRLVGADLDRDFTIQPLEKIEELVGGETVEMPVHQVGDFRLFDPEQGSDFRCLRFLSLSSL